MSFTLPVQTGLTAAGTNQGSALVLPNKPTTVFTCTRNSNVQIVTTTTPTNNGVKLPTCIAGSFFSIVNQGTSPLKVYPQNGNSIDKLITNSPSIVQSGTNSTFLTIDGQNFTTLTGSSSIQNAKSFGAQGDGKTDDTKALGNWFAAVCSGSGPGYLPAGQYKCNSQLVFDLSLAPTQGRMIYGDGTQQSIIDLTSVSVAPAMTLQCTSGGHSAFYWKFSDIGVIANLNGPTLAIGRFAGSPSGLDQLNSSSFERLTINNFNSGASSVGVQINGVFTCLFNLVVSNCATASSGDAWQINNSAHTTYNACAGGHALNAMRIANYYSFGNVFCGSDLEECTNCVTIDTPSGGCNTFVGGQWAYTGYGIYANPTSGHEIIAPNVATIVNNFISNGFGCRVRSPPLGMSFVTPSFPASGASCRNVTGMDMFVYMYRGTANVISVSIGGTSLGSGGAVSLGPYYLRATQTITFVFNSGTPAWVWTATS
jgi:hypothetical protein